MGAIMIENWSTVIIIPAASEEKEVIPMWSMEFPLIMMFELLFSSLCVVGPPPPNGLPILSPCYHFSQRLLCRHFLERSEYGNMLDGAPDGRRKNGGKKIRGLHNGAARASRELYVLSKK